jgi:hypothetical protein
MATYHKLNKQEFIFQLGTCASGTLASGGELSGYAALEGELFYIPEFKAVYVGDSSYNLNPSHGTAITASTVDVAASGLCVTPGTPSTSGDTAKAGLIWADANYIYVGVASNEWKCVAISGWS